FRAGAPPSLFFAAGFAAALLVGAFTAVLLAADFFTAALLSTAWEAWERSIRKSSRFLASLIQAGGRP
ncbi:hypothetical protein SB717_36655, partial [Priestia sp. SIMBA_032]